ncbi:hypothetical protein GC176_08620 [bacterium]|nr:hypothetical protein [bacterium]
MNTTPQHSTGSRQRVGDCVRNVSRNSGRRKGSTLLVVMALMGMLALLGLMFFSFASQEQENARNYLEAARLVHDPDLGPDVYFDWVLRQFITGPDPDEKHSALYPGHLSLMPNAYGSDAHPHTGIGIKVLNDRVTPQDAAGIGLTAYVDYDGDGTPDALDLDQDGLQDYLELNRSVAANVQNPNGGYPVQGMPQYPFEHQIASFPQPDVDYTYPDINNAYLAHIAKIWVHETSVSQDFNGNGVVDGTPYQITVIKPSFFRPELLMRLETSAGGSSMDEDANGDGIWDPLTEDANGNSVYDVTDFNHNGTQDPIARFDPTWYWQPWSRSLTLRAHPLHFYIPPYPPQIPGMPPPPPPAPPTELRYLRDWDPTDAAIIASLPGGSKGFPFAGPRDVNAPHDTIALREGVWRGWMQAPDSSLGISQYEFDVDADNDGVREAILMDLDFPVQERPSDGARYIPMFGLTVYDADGLINLNTSGNLSGDTTPPSAISAASGVFGNGRDQTTFSAWPPTAAEVPQLSISRSLHGLTPFEINPAWALDAYPIDPPGNPTPPPYQTVDVFGNTDYAEYFGRAPLGNGDIVNRWELANMEMWWLNKGRIEFGGSLPDIHEGRLGEANLVWQVLQAAGGGPSAGGVPMINLNLYDPSLSSQTINLFPFPGYFDRDDNRNANYGGATNVATDRTLAFGHPLSVSGRGRFISGSDPKTLDMQQPIASAMKWLRYTDYDVAGTPDLFNAVSGNLFPLTTTPPTLPNRTGRLFTSAGTIAGTADDYFVDDLTELVVEPRSAQQPADEYFAASDSAALQMSKTDIDAVGAHSRVIEVMPGNINPSDTSVSGNERRRRLTTTSWDRKQFNLPRLSAVGADGKPGVAGRDDNRNGFIDDAAELGWPGSDDNRAWEFNVDFDNDGLPEFPPQFPGVTAYSGYAQGTLPMLPQDPFRAELRRILNVELGNRNELKLQFRLGINGVLDVVRSGQNGGNSVTSPLQYRPLTPHPTSSSLPAGGLTAIAPGDFLPVLTSNAVANQEFWARYDR